jgi:hypothetical protein
LVTRTSGQPLVFEAVQSLPHRLLIQIHHRLAVRPLVASVHQRIH